MSEAYSPDLETALLQAGELLLNGWGYNWYRVENRLRADDILVRNQADALLGDALSALHRAEAGFRQAHLAVAARGTEGPDRERIAELRVFQAAMAALDACRTRLRGAPVPPPDRITPRFQSEAALLVQLGRCDARLAALAHALRADALAATPAGLSGASSSVDTHVRKLQGALDERERLLSVMQI